MTLALDKWLVNLIYKECKIAHRQVKVWGGKTSKLKAAIKTQITDEYGETFLDDANYVLFFKGTLLNEVNGLKKLFSTVNTALGKDANSLTESDFKKITSKIASTDIDNENNKLEANKEELDYLFVKITLK